jgi:hypothetical protein
MLSQCKDRRVEALQAALTILEQGCAECKAGCLMAALRKLMPADTPATQLEPTPVPLQTVEPQTKRPAGKPGPKRSLTCKQCGGENDARNGRLCKQCAREYGRRYYYNRKAKAAAEATSQAEPDPATLPHAPEPKSLVVPEAKDSRLMCPFCKSACSSDAAYRRHMELVHGKQVA